MSERKEMLLLRVETIIEIIAKPYNKGGFSENILAQNYLEDNILNYMEELICQ